MDDHVTKLLDLARGAPAPVGHTSLDDKTGALVLLGALIAAGGPPAAYFEPVHRALGRGASVDEIVDTLVAVSATVGTARVVSAARGLSLALGYDIDAALEGR